MSAKRLMSESKKILRPSVMRAIGQSTNRWLIALVAMLLSLAALGCDSEKDRERPKGVPPEPEAKSVVSAKTETPPRLVIDDQGPLVRGKGASLEKADGTVNPLGVSQLKEHLAVEKKFLEDQELLVTVDRRAKPSQVALFLNILGEFAPEKILVSTETRDEFPKELPFVPVMNLDDPPKCTLMGTILEDRGTAIWTVSGGTAHKRKRGMGGPDLTMTGETIERMSKTCDSELFVVTAAAGVEWGLIYDLAAAGVSSKKAGLSRAAIPPKQQTAGHALSL